MSVIPLWEAVSKHTLEKVITPRFRHASEHDPHFSKVGYMCAHYCVCMYMYATVPINIQTDTYTYALV